MRNLTHRWIQSNLYWKKLNHIFQSSKKGMGDLTPQPPSPLPLHTHTLVVRMTVKEGTRRQQDRTDPIHLFVSSKNEKNVPMINNDREHARKIEDRVFLFTTVFLQSRS